MTNPYRITGRDFLIPGETKHKTLTKSFAHRQIRLSGLNDTECLICSYVYTHENCSRDDVAKALCMKNHIAIDVIAIGISASLVNLLGEV